MLEDHKCDGLEDVSSSSPASSRSEIQWWLVGLQGFFDESEDILADDEAQCKKESHDRNAAQLNAERTHVIKGI